MAGYWEHRDRYSRGRYDYGRGDDPYRRDRDRDWTDRTGEEARPWFGDDEAQRRRLLDERRGYGGGYGRDYRGGYGAYAGRGYPEEPRAGYGGRDAGLGFDLGWGYPGRYGPGGFGLFGPLGYGRGYGGYGRDPYGGDYRGYGREGYRGSEDRGLLDRAGDEVASWFGDKGAEHRRDRDRSHRGRGPRGYARSDERIREDVSDRLTDDHHLDASEIEVSVSVSDREVTLNGMVEDRFAKHHAEDIADSVSGVEHVQNNLRVSTRTGTHRTTAGAAGGTTRT